MSISRDSIVDRKSELLEFFTLARAAGKTVGGYGAPAKATVLLNYCGIGKEFLPYVVDTTPHSSKANISRVSAYRSSMRTICSLTSPTMS